jgi:hypothetical protein
MTPATKEATVCGVILDIGPDGLCKNIETIISGGILKATT